MLHPRKTNTSMRFINVIAIATVTATITLMALGCSAKKDDVVAALAVPPAMKVQDVEKNTDGTIRFMTRVEAIKFCAQLGARLPSVRELALVSSRNCTTLTSDENCGAKGIVPSCDAADSNCSLIDAVNTDGAHDSFFFSREGYQRPAGELGDNGYWSSSLHNNNADIAYYLGGQDGGLHSFFSDIDGYIAVRCVLYK